MTLRREMYADETRRARLASGPMTEQTETVMQTFLNVSAADLAHGATYAQLQTCGRSLCSGVCAACNLRSAIIDFMAGFTYDLSTICVISLRTACFLSTQWGQ